MKTMLTRHVALVASVMAAGVMAAEPPSLKDLLADAAYRQLKISPDGKYFGVIVPVEGQNQLVTLTSDKTKAMYKFAFRESNESVRQFEWLKDNHLLLYPATVLGWDDAPQWYGDLLAASVDGKLFRYIYGYRSGEQQLGTHMKKNEGISGWGRLVSDLPDDPDSILVASTPWTVTGASTPSVLKIRLRDARTSKVLGAPHVNANFIASPKGEVRFATAVDADRVEHVFENQDGGWKEIAKNSDNKASMDPVGLSADGRTVYYLADASPGTNGLFSWNADTKSSVLVYQNEQDSINDVKLDPYTGEVLWVSYGPNRSVQFIKADHPASKVRQMLGKAFPDSRLAFTSITRDYKKAVFYVYSDRDPGVWYSVDTDSRKANLELEVNPKLSPDDMVPMKPIQLKSRDGLELNGFYTAKLQKNSGKSPMVLLVHGGPHAQDEWEFNSEVQMLATRGYAVLQINFRGSEGFGRDFELASRGQWGRAMQDDLTDATKWAIEQGLADPNRICIMGGSYGGYASLMGLIREPALYKCGIDMYGPTKLEAMFDDGDTSNLLWGEAYLRSELGNDEKEWAARSPVNFADRIQSPVLIIAGGKDQRVPIEHSEWMEKALKKAGKQVETLYFDSEGHGFYKLEHRVAAYQKVLDFLAKHIGQ